MSAGALLVLVQESSSLITGTYSAGLDSGWFGLHGQRAYTQNTFGFTVIGQFGQSATSFTGRDQLVYRFISKQIPLLD